MAQSSNSVRQAQLQASIPYHLVGTVENLFFSMWLNSLHLSNSLSKQPRIFYIHKYGLNINNKINIHVAEKKHRTTLLDELLVYENTYFFAWRRLLFMLKWDNMTPFGSPVVPLLYGRVKMDSVGLMSMFSGKAIPSSSSKVHSGRHLSPSPSITNISCK